MKTIHELGSPEWREWVFRSPPARDVRGRSRPTQRYIVTGLDGSPMVAEGGAAAVARSVITTSIFSGLVNRFKPEPFGLTLDKDGIEAVPDMLFEHADSRLFVPEFKSARYLTEEKLEKCRQVEQVVKKAGMTYLFWTDAWPLTPCVWRLMREMRRCGTGNVPETKLAELGKLISNGPHTFAQLREAGVYREFVLAAAWRGQVHFDLFSELSDETRVTSDVRDRRFDQVLHAPVGAQNFWLRLPRA